MNASPIDAGPVGDTGSGRSQDAGVAVDGGAHGSASDAGVAGPPTDLGPPPGLQLSGRWEIGPLAHSREIAVDGDIVYLGDANGLPVARSTAGGLAGLNGIAIAPKRPQHCSTISMHRRSHTLVCGAADSGFLDLIDVSAPATPRSRPWSVTEADRSALSPINEIHDVEVSGDTLWMAAQHNGLLRATLGADGMPTGVTRTGRGENVVAVLAAGGRLVLLDRVLGLLVVDEADLTIRSSTTLDGPPLDVVLDGDRVAVALGSEGVRLFRLVEGAPTLVASVQPRCVATGVALAGDRLAVACLSGVSLYDVSRPEPRVVGFVPARFGMLDVAFGPHGLLVTDWFSLEQFTTDLTGVVDLPEAPLGLRLQPGGDARIPVRNPGDGPLSVHWQLRVEDRTTVREGDLDLPAAGASELILPAADLVRAGSLERRATIWFSRDRAPTAASSRTATRVIHRATTEEPARGAVGIGDRFPVLRRTVTSPAPATMPPAGAATHVMFLTVDCYLQWPQLEDMAWARAHRSWQAFPTIFFLTTMNEDPFDHLRDLRVHGAEALAMVEWADFAGSVPGLETEPNPVRVFEQSFALPLPGADFPHDYLVAADGTTVDTVRMYRGRWGAPP